MRLPPGHKHEEVVYHDHVLAAMIGIKAIRRRCMKCRKLFKSYGTRRCGDCLNREDNLSAREIQAARMGKFMRPGRRSVAE